MLISNRAPPVLIYRTCNKINSKLIMCTLSSGFYRDLSNILWQLGLNMACESPHDHHNTYLTRVFSCLRLLKCFHITWRWNRLKSSETSSANLFSHAVWKPKNQKRKKKCVPWWCVCPSLYACVTPVYSVVGNICATSLSQGFFFMPSILSNSYRRLWLYMSFKGRGDRGDAGWYPVAFLALAVLKISRFRAASGVFVFIERV